MAVIQRKGRNNNWLNYIIFQCTVGIQMDLHYFGNHGRSIVL